MDALDDAYSEAVLDALAAAYPDADIRDCSGDREGISLGYDEEDLDEYGDIDDRADRAAIADIIREAWEEVATG